MPTEYAHPSRLFFGLACALIVETNFPKPAIVFQLFASNIPRYVLDFT